MVTKNGIIKRVAIEDFKNVRKSGLIAIKLKSGDNLERTCETKGDDQISIVTAKGMSIRFKEKDVRAMGRSASGVRAIKLKGDDVVVRMDVFGKESKNTDYDLMVITEHGFGKRTPMGEYKIQGRGGSGIKTANIGDKTGTIVTARIVNNKDLSRDLIVISEKGQVIRFPLKTVSKLGRSTKGVRIMRFKDVGDKVVSAVFAADES
jgi:DNA gyrase subunit A